MHSIQLIFCVVLVVFMGDFIGVESSERPLQLNQLIYEEPSNHRAVLVKRSTFPTQQEDTEYGDGGSIHGFWSLFRRIRHGRRHTRYRPIGNNCPDGQKMDRNGNCKKLWL